MAYTEIQQDAQPLQPLIPTRAAQLCAQTHFQSSAVGSPLPQHSPQQVAMASAATEGPSMLGRNCANRHLLLILQLPNRSILSCKQQGQDCQYHCYSNKMLRNPKRSFAKYPQVTKPPNMPVTSKSVQEHCCGRGLLPQPEEEELLNQYLCPAILILLPFFFSP